MVVTHADIAPNRKCDIGPMFDYEKAFKKYGVGFYPPNLNIELAYFTALTNDDYLELLNIFGYQKNIMGVSAFQLCYSKEDCSGELSYITKTAILNLCIAFYIYSNVSDKIFKISFEQFIQNKSSEAFNTYISN